MCSATCYLFLDYITTYSNWVVFHLSMKPNCLSMKPNCPFQFHSHCYYCYCCCCTLYNYLSNYYFHNNHFNIISIILYGYVFITMVHASFCGFTFKILQHVFTTLVHVLLFEFFLVLLISTQPSPLNWTTLVCQSAWEYVPIGWLFCCRSIVYSFIWYFSYCQKWTIVIIVIYLALFHLSKKRDSPNQYYL